MKGAKMFLGMLCIYVVSFGQDSDMGKVFNHIYSDALWGKNQEGKGFSGNGSRVENTTSYMTFLENFLHENQIKSVVDIGCGDWTFSQHINWDNIDYVGYDVVKSVIDQDSARFSSAHIKFICDDCVKVDLPQADLLICKDVLQHLPNKTIQALLDKFSHYKYCLITNDIYPKTAAVDNPDISLGDWRSIDLTKPPFNAKGIKVFTYRSGYTTKQVLLIIR